MTRRLVVNGLLAVLAASAATTVVAALARTAGVDFALPDGGESIPLSGFAVVTGLFTFVGVLVAAGLQRWSRQPAQHFVRTTVTLTAISLVPPFLVGATAATAATLALLHLVAAAVVIPAVARSLASPVVVGVAG